MQQPGPFLYGCQDAPSIKKTSAPSTKTIQLSLLLKRVEAIDAVANYF